MQRPLPSFLWTLSRSLSRALSFALSRALSLTLSLCLVFFILFSLLNIIFLFSSPRCFQLFLPLHVFWREDACVWGGGVYMLSVSLPRSLLCSSWEGLQYHSCSLYWLASIGFLLSHWPKFTAAIIQLDLEPSWVYLDTSTVVCQTQAVGTMRCCVSDWE